MGKGSGGCARPALTLGEVQSTEHGLIDRGHVDPPAWAAEIDRLGEEELLALLDGPLDYPQRMVATERLAMLVEPERIGRLDDDVLSALRDQINQIDEEMTEAGMDRWYDQRRDDDREQAENLVLHGVGWLSSIASDVAKNDERWQELQRIGFDARDHCHAARAARQEIIELMGRKNLELERNAELRYRLLAANAELEEAVERLNSARDAVQKRWKEVAGQYNYVRGRWEGGSEEVRSRIEAEQRMQLPQFEEECERIHQTAISDHRRHLTVKREQIEEQLALDEASRRPISRPVWSWEPQRLTEDDRDAARRGESIPIFVEGSVCTDGVLYLDHGLERVVEVSDVQRVDGLNLHEMPSLDGVPRHVPRHKQRMWIAAFNRARKADYGADEAVGPAAVAMIRSEWPAFDQQPEAWRTAVEEAFSSSAAPARQTVWGDGEHRWRVRADVDEQRDERAARALIAAGARVEHHDVEVPTYESGHHIGTGQRFSLPIDGGEIRYVPHRSVGVDDRWAWRQRGAVDPTAVDRAELGLRIARSMKTRSSLRECFIIGEGPNERIYELDELGFVRHQRVLASLDKGTPFRMHDRETSPTVPVRRATAEEMAAAVDKGRYLRLEDGSFLRTDSAAVGRYRQLQRGADTWCARKRQVAVEWTSPDEQPSSESTAGALAAVATQRDHWPSDLRTLFSAGLLEPSVEESERYQHREEVLHAAPMSERGQLTVVGLSPGKAMAALERVGLTEGRYRTVPTLVYEGGRRRGRITPREPRLHARLATIEPPEGTMLLHGMTGVKNDEQALDRLDRLIASGGLQSIAERRHRGINVRSLSPLGDIASGIDRGVPCVIGDQPSYGRHIFFGLKPEALERRDVWFSDRDFGAGESRYDKYNHYAKRIGQGTMHAPPSVKARHRHLERGCSRDDNETYFLHGIPLDHVDTVFVYGSELAEATRDRVERHGLGWRVEEVGRDGITDAIRRRSAQLHVERAGPRVDSLAWASKKRVTDP